MLRAIPPSSGFWRIAPQLAGATVVLLLLAAVGTTVLSERAFTSQKVDEVTVSARILAATVTAALAFNDRNTAAEYVGYLRANPEIVAAAVYDAGGQLFASYARQGQRLPPAPAATTYGSVVDDGQITVAEPVIQAGSRVGSVVLSTIVEPFSSRLPRYAVIGLLIVMAAVLILVLGAAQSALGRANRELRERADELATANRNLQAEIETREKAETALRQIQKMETIGQLTGGVAHDFNNLLTIILGNLERLQRRLDSGADAAELKKIAGFAKIGADRAASLTRSLLAFARRQPLDPKPIDLNRLVGNMSDLLRRTLGEQISVEMVGAAGLWRARADPNQLENAILNLAVNARDAMPEGGKLTIETGNTHLDPRYAEDAGVSPGQYVVLAVSDTGSGMSADVIEHAFDPFFTTKDVGHGTGLGLSQVYGFVTQSGGTVKIYSEIGQGTTVKIYLPRLHGEMPIEAAERPVAAPDGRDETVLLVEDDDGVRRHSVEMLGELGYRVLEAANGAEALAIIDARPEIVVLFTDIGLPGGMNGRQLADEACRRRPKLRVLYTTGYARNAIVHDGRLDPGVHLLPKPFSYADLAAALQSVFRDDPVAGGE